MKLLTMGCCWRPGI